MARQASALQAALHADERILAQSLERFFAEITTKRIRRGIFRSVADLAGDHASCRRMSERARKAFGHSRMEALLDSLGPTTSSATNTEPGIAEDSAAWAKNAQ